MYKIVSKIFFAKRILGSRVDIFSSNLPSSINLNFSMSTFGYPLFISSREYIINNQNLLEIT